MDIGRRKMTNKQLEKLLEGLKERLERFYENEENRKRYEEWRKCR